MDIRGDDEESVVSTSTEDNHNIRAWTHEKVKETLKTAKPNDIVEVEWSAKGHQRTTWKGKLTRKAARGTWSVTYDIDEEREMDTHIPNATITYFRVTVEPATPTQPEPTPVPTGPVRTPPTRTPPTQSKAPVPPGPRAAETAKTQVPVTSGPKRTPVPPTQTHAPVPPGPTTATPQTALTHAPVPSGPKKAPVPPAQTHAPVPPEPKTAPAHAPAPTAHKKAPPPPYTAILRRPHPPTDDFTTEEGREHAMEEIRPLAEDLLAEAVALPPGNRYSFASGVTDLKGGDLFRYKVEPNPLCSELTLQSLAKTTRKCHRRTIKALQAMDQDLRNLPLDKALCEFITRERIRKKWLWTTTTTKMCSIQGALRVLFMHAKTDDNILLKTSPHWVAALAAASKLARQSHPNQPFAATYAHVQKAVELETRRPVKAALILAWLTAARGGDILRLRPTNVTFMSPVHIAVKFVRHKTARTRDPYTVDSTGLPPQWQWVQQYVKDTRTFWLFQGVKGEDLKVALRRADSRLEQRSLRRGAIQTLATQMPDERLLHYSGHASVAMLRRYLDYGAKSGEAAGRAIAAAALTA